MPVDKLNERTKEYERSFEKYGYSPLALSMPSDRRNIRYAELLKHCPFEIDDLIIFDAGCGFGDINGYLDRIGVKDYTYIGVDVVESFILEGQKRYGNHPKRHFEKIDFTHDDLSNYHFDWAVSSQAFNYPYGTDEENFENLCFSISRLFQQC